MRAEPPDPYYPTPPVFSDTQSSCSSTLQRIFAHRQRFAMSFVHLVMKSITLDWWHPTKLGGQLQLQSVPACPQSQQLFLWSESIFRSLRFIPSGHKTPLFQSKACTSQVTNSPYRIFYNVYKPNIPFKKSAPGKPDFQVVVSSTFALLHYDTCFNLHG